MVIEFHPYKLYKLIYNKDVIFPYLPNVTQNIQEQIREFLSGNNL